MIRDTCDTSLTFENIEELKYWLGYKRLVDYMGFEVAFCTIGDINNALLQMEGGTVYIGLKRLKFKEDSNNVTINK